jgi:hypothetical protein
LKESCALTLARKLKIKTLRKVLRKFGKDLSVIIKTKNGDKRVSLFFPESLVKHNIKDSINPNTEPIKALDKV